MKHGLVPLLRSRADRYSFATACAGTGVADVGRVCVWAAAAAAESSRVPLAARWRFMMRAMNTPAKLNAAITHDANARPAERPSEAVLPAAIRFAVTVA